MHRKLLVGNELIIYFILAFTFTWSVSLPLILSRFEIINSVPLWLHNLTAYGPFLAAFIVEGIYRGKSGIKKLCTGILKWRIGFWLFVFSAISPIFALSLAIISVYIITGKGVNWDLFGQIDNLPSLGILGSILFCVLNSGIGEEVGWRGFALPRLQKTKSAFTSSIILGIIWSAWHLPFFFYVPYYLNWGIISFPAQMIGLIIASILFTWLYNSTKGSILAAALFHGVYDFAVTTKGVSEYVPIIVGAVFAIWAISIPFIFKTRNLSGLEKQKI
jgi:membrane protease YdiL (CAAX protease family)